jgi:two-component system OmpR family sensor kinase
VLLIPLSAAGIWIVTRRGLRPLADLRREIALRGSANLQPIRDDNLPGELTPIAVALSRLIERVRAALDAERQFAANSAHELRTPIAGALAQTQRLIETADDERVRAEGRKIEGALRRLAALSEKLLQLARADAGMAASGEPTLVVPIVNLVLADARTQGVVPRTFELKVAPGAEGVCAAINIDALGIVLRNIVDNAIAHSPPDTPVEVEITGGATIVVRNASAVVPPEAMAKLTSRFERGPTSASGSGLGLAIVDTILSQIGGRLALHSPATGRADGFEAVITLPQK